MTMSAAEFDKVFGSAWHTGADAIKKRLTFVEYAGIPTNNVTPDFVGQDCFDTANSEWYRSVGLAAADWDKLSN
jgi:hypothetical protein